MNLVEIKRDFIAGLTELIEQYGDNTVLEVANDCGGNPTIRLSIRDQVGRRYLVNIGNHFCTELDEYE